MPYKAHLPSDHSLAEQGGDPYLTVEPGCDARPAVVGRRPVRARGVPLVALKQTNVNRILERERNYLVSLPYLQPQDLGHFGAVEPIYDPAARRAAQDVISPGGEGELPPPAVSRVDGVLGEVGVVEAVLEHALSRLVHAPRAEDAPRRDGVHGGLVGRQAQREHGLQGLDGMGVKL